MLRHFLLSKFRSLSVFDFSEYHSLISAIEGALAAESKILEGEKASFTKDFLTVANSFPKEVCFGLEDFAKEEDHKMKNDEEELKIFSTLVKDLQVLQKIHDEMSKLQADYNKVKQATQKAESAAKGSSDPKLISRLE